MITAASREAARVIQLSSLPMKKSGASRLTPGTSQNHTRQPMPKREASLKKLVLSEAIYLCSCGLVLGIKMVHLTLEPHDLPGLFT